jgi:hypothetical protein
VTADRCGIVEDGSSYKSYTMKTNRSTRIRQGTASFETILSRLNSKPYSDT